jgi:prephenate dehydrogenase
VTRPFERVVIAGVGLIGGSLALAARRAGLVGEIVGFGRTRENLDIALTRGLVDRVSQDPLEAARGADLLVLAVPVAATAKVAQSMAGVLAPGAVVTDAGSVKARVVREVSSVLPAGVRFVGAHPIAGTEDSGAAAARHDLYDGCRCILTPTGETDADALERVEALWRGVGAQVERMSPERHDEILAWVSHVPHMLAYALMATAPADTHSYAGPSFRDVTRVAASPVEMWRDILLYNDEALGRSLDGVLATLQSLRAAIRRGDAEAASQIFARARSARRALEGRKG